MAHGEILLYHDQTTGKAAPATGSGGALNVNAVVSASVNGFQPNGNYATLAVSAASANVALPAGATVVVYNTAAVTAFVNLGPDNTVTATTTQIPVSAGGAVGLTVGTNSWIAGITGAGSGTLILVAGTGLFSGFAGSAAAGTTNTNLTQIAGTAVDANSGNKSAGTQRVVLATDQPALTTPMPVSGTVSITANSAVNVAQVGGTATDTNSGVKSAGTQRIVIATDQPSLTNPLTVTANAGTNLNTSALALEAGGNLALVKAKTDNLDVALSTRLKPADTLTAVTTVGTITNPVTAVGAAASGVAVTGNPLLSGGRAATTNPGAVTDGQAVAAMLDAYGKLVSVLNAPRALKGVATASTTGNTAITLIAAGAAGVYNDIEALWFDNTSATGIDVTLSDGTNSHHFYVPPTDTRGLSIPTMLIAASTATAWQITSSASVTTLYASATFVKRTG